MLGTNLPSGLDTLAGPSTYWTVVACAFGIGLALNLWVRRRVSHRRPVVPVSAS